MKDRQRIGRARFASDGDEDATSASQCLEDPTVVRLKTDTTHGAGESQFREIARAPLQSLDERAARHDRTDAGDIEAPAARTKRLLNQRRRFRSVPRKNRQRF